MELVRAVRWAIITSVILSVGAGILFEQAANHALWEAILGTTAAVMVASMTIYMLRTGKRMHHHIEEGLELRLGRADGASFLGVFFFTVLVMTREGMETALLFASILFQVRSASALGGGMLGVGVAAGIAWLWSRYDHRVPLGRFLEVPMSESRRRYSGGGTIALPNEGRYARHVLASLSATDGRCTRSRAQRHARGPDGRS